MTSRRSFLAGLVAAAAAPAIVRSESLMKLWVPAQDIIVPHVGWDLGAGDWSAEAWVHVGVWRVVHLTNKGAYIDGKPVRNDHPLIKASVRPIVESGPIYPVWGGQMDEVRLVKGHA